MQPMRQKNLGASPKNNDESSDTGQTTQQDPLACFQSYDK